MSNKTIKALAAEFRRRKIADYKKGVLKNNVNVSTYYPPKIGAVGKKMKRARSKNRPAIIKVKASTSLVKIENILQKKNFEGSPQMSACLKKIDHLCNHPRLKNIALTSMNSFTSCFMVFNQGSKKYSSVFPGIKNTLRGVFYPDTSENPIEKSKRNRAIGGRSKMYYEPSSSKKGSACATHGKEHGEIVHRQLEKITEYVIKNKTLASCQSVFPDGLDRCVDAFLTLCEEKSWFPLRSEYMIYDEDLHIATAVDMFLVNLKTWKLIKVDFKTGGESEEYTMHPNDNTFKTPLEDITNCPMNRDMLQLLGMDLILNAKMGISTDEDYIVRMCPKAESIELYSPPEWYTMESYRTATYGALLNRKKSRYSKQ